MPAELFSREKNWKFNDAELASQLWPTYLRHGGNLEAVLAFAKAEGVAISKPTLLKMRDHFGWPEKLSTSQKSSFAASIDNTGELLDLLAEVVDQKNNVQKSLKESPDDLSRHRQYGDYVGQILNIRSAINKARSVDKDTLLVDALKAVVGWLLKQGETAAAESMGDSLEEIASGIKDGWKGL